MSKHLGCIKSFQRTDKEYSIHYSNGETATLNILTTNVFKFYMSRTGDFVEYPKPNNPNDTAKINVKKVTDYGKNAFNCSILRETNNEFFVFTNKISIQFDKVKGTMKVQDLPSNRDILVETEPLYYDDTKVKQTLRQHQDEYFFGGGMQNGRFTHKGHKILILNSNKWEDGGVTSACPFYWSSKGYGVLRNTWQPGVYDFGSKNTDIIETSHSDPSFDAFFFINLDARNILKDYYELTGQPIFMPEFAFYEVHLNKFNRDYWVKVDKNDPKAILFEDGFYYKCYQPNEMICKDGILETLNGEKNNYQFSARAMIDRYQKHDMPLGWFIPNDGYGSGYGQTDSLDGDIENLRQFVEYAKHKGVETALWTNTNLEPKNPKKGERDFCKEVAKAGIVALKCDGSFIGAGNSSALTAVENATIIFKKAANTQTRPFIIMVGGWAGTQRDAGIWTGNQTGGLWENIRFHIPTYIGASLSGIPIVGSDMDGIFGGGDKNVNIRDYQWKTFTPLQLNMDGWSNIQKTPFGFDDEAKLIIRAYLKLKSMLMPYNYTIAHDSVHGLPMIRAMFLEFPNENSGYTIDSQYQYMWGPNILIAPVFKEQYDTNGEWIRHSVYLPNPDQVWVDFMTGEKYQGGKIWNCIKSPLWKLPIFVKDGAILPMYHPNNNPNQIERDVRIFNIYPNGESTFEVYEDDGISSDYLTGNNAKTKITVTGPNTSGHGDLDIHIHKTVGSYKNIVKHRSTLIRIMATANIKQLTAMINNDTIDIRMVETEEEFLVTENVYYFNNNYLVNLYLKDIPYDALKQKYLMIRIRECDVTNCDINIKIKGLENKTKIFGSNSHNLNNSLRIPEKFTVFDQDITRTSICLRWDAQKDVYFEIERDGTLFTNITGTEFQFDGFKFGTEHKFRIRSANSHGVSNWSYYILVSTKQSPCEHIVKNIKVVCNIPDQPGEEINKLIDGDLTTLWHTIWSRPNEADPAIGKIIKLNFDLEKVYEIDRMEYIPREDAHNGTILQLQYRFSLDNQTWSPISSTLYWEKDKTTKTILLQGQQMRYFEINILNSVGGFGAGRAIAFYKK